NEIYDPCDMHFASEDNRWIATKGKLVSENDGGYSFGNGHILFTDPKTSSLIVQAEKHVAFYRRHANGKPILDHVIEGASLVNTLRLSCHKDWKLHCFWPQKNLFICMTEDKKGILFWDLAAKKAKDMPLVLLENLQREQITCIRYDAESDLLFTAILD